ncbi:MAG: hypothetical protein CGU28_14670 [Candidatus Dactylopiibacterium carminicum]|uniref:C4-dicarboxylate ABC transporter n=1 Tax=Candidatus Dactylopiibacterium carminicum TaxID=857335 RepID=A0A272ENP0_9RHOO|nr:TRAP transporter substrate-binding protein DctP [Candidatus Dactylopiibacterium carminicum]KAF7598107.1 hypothetical protein BGI27_15140 [Candidatus Dactylopiibacterium carminicum]PAS91723.1 MAG: hypothetical protein CGU29_14800 [Candidatus Dactylopiibacterium carminicum]PAS93863.1 MAG: hypothetical protein CGU28_14670 [Candidatus Dactylopiibacterium carminicum]PAS96623.1 MAG: hypothetical protein BSR46_15185 [Candidatus Dactylopiibacterium carminicum]
MRIFIRSLLLGLFAAVQLALIPANAIDLKGWVREDKEFTQHQALLFFFDRLRTLSQGRYTGRVACCEDLGGQAKVIPVFQKGEVDIVLFYPSALTKDVPEVEVLNLPFLFRDPAHMMAALNGEVGAEYQNMLAAKGYAILAWYDGGSRSFYSRSKSLVYFSDFKGQTVRIAKKDHIGMVEALGAKPSQLAYDKLSAALKSGEVDIAENNLTSYYTSEHYKVAPFYTFSHHSVSLIALLVSSQRWKSLTESDKALFRQAALESSAEASRLRAAEDADVRAKLEKLGVKFFNFRSASTVISQMKTTYEPVVKTPKATDLMLKIMTTQSPAQR